MKKSQLKLVTVLLFTAIIVLPLCGATFRLLVTFISPIYAVSPVFHETFFTCLPYVLLPIVLYWLYVAYRRIKFLEQLREYWSRLTFAVNAAVEYTYMDKPSQEHFDEICTLLGQAIDDLRSFYTNVKKYPDDHGLYPFEPIKQIQYTIRGLGCCEVSELQRSEARARIEDYWKSMREDFLSEFDRFTPEKPVSQYIRKRESNQ